MQAHIEISLLVLRGIYLHFLIHWLNKRCVIAVGLAQIALGAEYLQVAHVI
jgi:hypothetical protein